MNMGGYRDYLKMGGQHLRHESVDLVPPDVALNANRLNNIL